MDKANQAPTDTWTPEAVADRFEEAAKTARNLPPVRVQGYFSVWPRIVREQWASLSGDEKSSYRAPPTPEATARMQEVMQQLGIAKKTLYDKLHRHSINPDDYR